MVLKRSVFEIQKQRTKNCKDPSYGCGAIHENVPKLRNKTSIQKNILTLPLTDFFPNANPPIKKSSKLFFSLLL